MRIVTFAALASVAVAAPAQELPPGPELERARYDGCVRAVPTQAANALEFAEGWKMRGGGLPAMHCAALALLRLERFGDAARMLERAGQEAEASKAPQAADFWGQAGNAWFLDGKHGQAIAAFDRAIGLVGQFAPQRASALHVDRARVAADAGNLAAARADLDQAVALAPDDAVAVMLSAALARRQGEMGRAAREIARASELAPGDADIMLEQANIAAASGDREAAEKVWAMVVKAAPGSAAAEIAGKALAGVPAP